jgi:hypothetical protein
MQTVQHEPLPQMAAHHLCGISLISRDNVLILSLFLFFWASQKGIWCYDINKYIFFLKCHIYTRIITFCAVDIIRKTLAVVFERELLGFLHVGRLEHHAIATVARLPK